MRKYLWTLLLLIMILYAFSFLSLHVKNINAPITSSSLDKTSSMKLQLREEKLSEIPTKDSELKSEAEAEEQKRKLATIESLQLRKFSKAEILDLMNFQLDAISKDKSLDSKTLSDLKKKIEGFKQNSQDEIKESELP